MNGLNAELRKELMEKGASLVGFADLKELPEAVRQGMRYGVIVGVALNPNIVNGLRNGPTVEYHGEYIRVNNLLDDLDDHAAAILKKHGFDAIPMTKKAVAIDEATRRTVLPHKTVATRAGLGWIGKCALLVTEQYGSAVRISTCLTNAELETGDPVNSSRCGGCTICADVCPGKAVAGKNWSAGLDRDSFFNAHECRRTAIERAAKVGVNESICGLCILTCPWTKRYIESCGLKYNGNMRL